MLKGLEKMK